MRREFDIRDEVLDVKEFIIEASVFDKLPTTVNRNTLYKNYGMVFRHRITGTDEQNDVYVFDVYDDKKMSKFCLKYEAYGSLINKKKVIQSIHNLK
jgi:hypothetical protein